MFEKNIEKIEKIEMDKIKIKKIKIEKILVTIQLRNQTINF